MMSLSQTSGYAVHALSCLHFAASPTCQIREIAHCTGLPKPYLAKIVNSLQHHGIVYAKRGHAGGIALARSPDRITLLEVVEAVEGPKWICDCLWGLEDCDARRICATHGAWKKLRNQIKHLLRSTTLADTVSFSKLMRPHLGNGGIKTSQRCCLKRQSSKKRNSAGRLPSQGR